MKPEHRIPYPGYIILVLIMAVVFNWQATFAGAEDAVIRYHHYAILFSEDDRNNANIVKELLINDHQLLTAFYQVEPTEQVLIRLSQSQEAFLEYHKGVPHWAAAVYIPSQKTILLKSPASVGSISQLKKDFLHELSHLFFDIKFVSAKLPLWYNEGLAKYLSGEQIRLMDAIDLSTAVTREQTIPLEHIDYLTNFGKRRARLAYLQSLSALLYFKKPFYKEEQWQAFHNAVVDSGWDTAVLNHTQMAYADFEYYWLKYLEEKYRWSVLFSLSDFLWFGMAAIVLIGFVISRIRNRKKIKDWEKNEGEWMDL